MDGPVGEMLASQARGPEFESQKLCEMHALTLLG